MAIVDLKQRSPEWLEWRKTGVTASMIPIIMSDSPYMTRYQLWAEFVGLKQPDDLSKNWHVQRGVEQEPEALQAVQSVYGKLFMPCCVESDLNPLFKASLDGISIDGTKEVVEIKCPCLKVYENIIREKTNSKEFRLYYGQVQWQMLVADTDKAILFIYFRGKRPLQIKIKRNEAYIIKAQQAALEFWSLVQSNVPPELTGQDSIVYDVQESVQDEWLSLATKYLELETIVNAKKADIANDSDRLSELKNELIKLIPIESNSIQKSGVKVTKSERQGRVDLAKIERFFLDKNLIVSLDDFRGETTTSYRISTYKEINSNTQFEQNPEVSNIETTKNNDTTKNVDPVVVEDITEIEAQKNEIQITDPKTFFEKEINPINVQPEQPVTINQEETKEITHKVEAFKFF